MLYLTILSVFASVALIVGGILYFVLTRRNVIQERLEKLMPSKVVVESKPTLIREGTPLQKFLGRLGRKMPTRSQERVNYTKFLVGAGFRKETLHIFIGCKIVLSLLLPGLLILLYSLPKGLVLNSEFLLLEIALAITGYLLPSLWLQNRVKARKLEIFHTLPDILDMLTVCVEAGMGVDAALVKATDHPQFKGNPLAEEFKTVGRETRAGKIRTEAMRDMADRTMVDDISALVTMLIQTERFGTSLSQALRVHSDSLRTKRRQIAEEAAAKTAIKMLFPLVFFVFPALFVALIGPALLSFRLLFK
ncbi:MAG: type II secretion system F family protein [Pelobacteraceae bacterium]